MTTDKKRDLILPGCRIRLPVLMTVLALVQIAGAVYAVQVPPELAAQVSQPMALLVVGGLLWAFLFLVVTINLIQGRRHARRIAVAVIVIFACYHVARWIIFTEADYDRARLPFLIFGTFCVVLILVASYYDLKAGRLQQTERAADDSGP